MLNKINVDDYMSEYSKKDDRPKLKLKIGPKLGKNSKNTDKTDAVEERKENKDKKVENPSLATEIQTNKQKSKLRPKLGQKFKAIGEAKAIEEGEHSNNKKGERWSMVTPTEDQKKKQKLDPKLKITLRRSSEQPIISECSSSVNLTPTNEDETISLGDSDDDDLQMITPSKSPVPKPLKKRLSSSNSFRMVSLSTPQISGSDLKSDISEKNPPISPTVSIPIANLRETGSGQPNDLEVASRLQNDTVTSATSLSPVTEVLQKPKKECDICHVHVTDLSGHKRRKHSTNLLICEYCHRSYPLKSALDRHIQSHLKRRELNEEGKFTCAICSLEFLTHDHEYQHMNSIEHQMRVDEMMLPPVHPPTQMNQVNRIFDYIHPVKNNPQKLHRNLKKLILSVGF
jgi:hypothetical protein